MHRVAAAAVLAASTALAAPATAPPARVEVKDLPGYGPPPSRLWSGFVSGGTPPSGKGTMYFHYLMFEAEEADPATAPSVFWYNGGPGASSLFGLFQELGPLYLNEDSEATADFKRTGIPTPLRNPYSWSKKFNLFAIDSPAPVGYSYCTEQGPEGKGPSCGPWKDTDVFKANREVIARLFDEVFPELAGNEVFITGESYAGIYVPGLVDQLITAPGKVNLKGYAVGDGCIGSTEHCRGPLYDIDFFGGHGQFSNELRYKIRDECPRDALCSGKLSAACEGYVQEMYKEVGAYYVYDLYDDCPTNVFGAAGRRADVEARLRARGRQRVQNTPELRAAVNDYVCSGTALADYLDREEVKAAFGVPQDDYFFNADNGVGFNYTGDVDAVLPFHKRAVEHGLRVLTYEGDADACGLNSMGYLQDAYVAFWPNEAGLERTTAWRPWTVDGKSRMGGYCMEWGGGQASWISIRGSGHLVPLNKPAQAYTMINAFVFNTGYPTLNE